MAFDWREYLNLSRLLQGQTGQTAFIEAALRSAVSRAYYSAFCHARNYARDRQGYVSAKKKWKDHGLVRKHFSRRRGQTRVAGLLGSLRQWRNDCDYRDTVGDLDKMVTESIKSAEDVFGMLT
jgi:hypothetical protein